MPDREGLRSAALQVDIFAVADRIVGNPEREAPKASAAETYALAAGVTELGRIMLETKLLVRAIRWPAGLPAAEHQQRRNRLDDQLSCVEGLLAELRHTLPPEGEAT